MRTNLIFIILFGLSLYGCSSDLEYQNSESLIGYMINSKDDVDNHISEINNEVRKIDSSYLTFKSSSFNSDLKKMRNTSINTINVVRGYDKRVVLKKYLLTFGFPYDSRLETNVHYYTELCQYVKYIDVPKGYSVIIPGGNSSILRLLPTLNMGYIPNSQLQGYALQTVSSTQNKFALVTNVEEIIKNNKTNKKLSPIFYIPQDLQPSKFEFKYQIVSLSWD